MAKISGVMELAMELTKNEKGERQVDIANALEIVKVLQKLTKEHPVRMMWLLLFGK